MERLSITCDSCDRLWAVAGHLSLYQQQSLESRPCPQCGAYTLTCLDQNLLLRDEMEQRRQTDSVSKP